MNCAECGHPAAVLHGDVPMCGACFYKHSMWRRLAEAIASLETIAARIAAEMDELVKSREPKD